MLVTVAGIVMLGEADALEEGIASDAGDAAWKCEADQLGASEKGNVTDFA